MTMTTTDKLTVIDAPARDEHIVTLTPKAFRDMLIELSIQSNARPMFASFEAEYNMDDKGKMNKGRGANRNPYLGKGLKKLAKTNVLVNFDYSAALERRTEGKETAADGNWQQAVIVDGKLTPLAIHKADIKTQPKADAEAKNLKGYAALEAVYDAEGSIIIEAEEPRCYLRCEYRSSESTYILDGEEVSAEAVKPWLPKRQPQTVEHHTVTLANVTVARFDGTTYHISRS